MCTFEFWFFSCDFFSKVFSLCSQCFLLCSFRLIVKKKQVRNNYPIPQQKHTSCGSVGMYVYMSPAYIISYTYYFNCVSKREEKNVTVLFYTYFWCLCLNKKKLLCPPPPSNQEPVPKSKKSSVFTSWNVCVVLDNCCRLITKTCTKKIQIRLENCSE